MSLINPINIVDARIDHIKSDIDFAVYNGSAECTFQNFPSNSQTNSSSIIYNVQVPSMSTIIDRNMMQQATIAVQVSCGAVPTGNLCFNYGYTDALQAFPLNSLVTTQQATINNTTVTVNLQDVLAQLLRMYDNETLQRYNSTTPSLPDMLWKYYANAVGTSSNPLASYNNATYNLNLMPRGAYPVTISNVVHNITAGGTDTSFVSTNVADTWTFTLTVTVTEPILGLSPFLHTDNNNNAGFVGINNMSLQFNLQQTCNRFLSSSTGYVTGISLTSITNCKLLMNFLSLQPEQYSKISPRNVLPYVDFV